MAIMAAQPLPAVRLRPTPMSRTSRGSRGHLPSVIGADNTSSQAADQRLLNVARLPIGLRHNQVLPDVTSWSAVAHALDHAGLGRPSGFTHEVVFRRCPDCQEHNIVREDDFVCVFCGSDLPETWNVDPTA